jgi:hypothetical protein
MIPIARYLFVCFHDTGRMFDKAEYEDPTFLWSVLDATHKQALTRGSQAKSLPIRG